MDRFRQESVWNLQVDDVVKFRAGKARVRGKITELTRAPQDGSVSGRLSTAEGLDLPFRLTSASRVYRRLLPFAELMAEVEEPKGRDEPGGAANL